MTADLRTAASVRWLKSWKKSRVSQSPVALVAAGLVVFSVVFALNAWISEDAYITFRSLEQLAAGNGLRWNPHERVQVYTHPLWFFLLASARALSADVFLNAIVASYLVCLAALVQLRGVVGSGPRWLALVAVLISSKSFVDYTTSGLENPLSYLLLAVFAGRLLRSAEPAARGGAVHIRALSIVLSLLLLCRPDLLTLIGPAYAWVLWHHRRVGVRAWLVAVGLGLSPLLLWALFSLFYFGTLIPNPAYAKLATGIPQQKLIAQGLHYLESLGRFDLILLPLLAVATMRGLLSERPALRALALGLPLNLVYVVWVGGDFMAGRFVACALLQSAVLLVLVPWRAGFAPALALGLVVFAAVSPFSPLRSTPSYSYARIEQQIGDERGIFFPVSSLAAWWSRPPGGVFPDYHWSHEGLEVRHSKRRVIPGGTVGMFGYWAGTEKIIVDQLALADPLLARLPSRGFWRIGHFARPPPLGYIEGLRVGENQIEDSDLHAFYDVLRLVTQGDLASFERLNAILWLNLGAYDSLLHGNYEASRPPGKARSKAAARK